MKKDLEILHEEINCTEEAERILRNFAFKWCCFGIMIGMAIEAIIITIL